MKIPFRRLAGSITGITTPLGGVSWTPLSFDADSAARIVTFLENRRVLYSPYELEVPSHVVESILQIRDMLNRECAALSRSAPLFATLRTMEAACRKFLDTAQEIAGERGDSGHAPERRMLPFAGYDLRGLDEWKFLSALGELRGTFGICIVSIASHYHIDVSSEMETILPYGPSGD